IGGMISMMNGTCHLLPTTWEWKEDIDLQRAQAAKERAEKLLAQGGMDEAAYKTAEAKFRRSIVRLGVKNS
ncbi:MAG: F0F1 ATP synthase subunit epsilon, partial [Eubacterium sp.]|nr:F0F1 ATP synthase subunit epsilon [Eubacterium sp.]